MGQNSTKSQGGVSSKRKERGIAGTLAYLMTLVILTSCLGWFLTSVWFCLYQLKEGEEKTQMEMNSIISFYVELINNKNHSPAGDAYQAFESSKRRVLNEAFAKGRILHLWQWLDEKIKHSRYLTQKETSIKNKVSNIWDRVFRPLLTVFVASTSIVLIRIFILLLSLPFFLLWVCLGFVDGLVQRDVRKFQAARESTYFFHRIKKIWKSCFFVPLLFYFVWPFVINPLWFFVPMAMMLGLSVQISFKYFKKYV